MVRCIPPLRGDASRGLAIHVRKTSSTYQYSMVAISINKYHISKVCIVHAREQKRISASTVGV